MGKVTFEFNDGEESDDIELTVNRRKLISALYDLQSYRRSIYKGYINNTLIVVGDKVVARASNQLADYDIETAKAYLEVDDILRELDYILDKVQFLLD